MESQHPLTVVMDEYRAMRSRDRSGDHTGYLQEQLALEWSDDERFTIRGMLIGELQLLGQLEKAERLMAEDVACNAEEPYYSLRLAEHFHYCDVDLSKALSNIGLAIVKARADGKFLYQCLGIRARLAIETQSWPLLATTLQEMSNYEHHAGDADVFPETDFLSRIPTGTIDPNITAAYASRVAYLRSIGYSALTGRSIGLPSAAAEL